MKKKQTSFLYKMVLSCSRFILKSLYNLKVYGLENYYPNGAILACNHTSFLDPSIIAVLWPEEVHFVVRASLFKIPVLGSVIKKLNTHPVGKQEGYLGTIRTVCSLITRKKKVVVFPEGTRSYDGSLHSFKRGVAMIAEKTDSAIIPIYIDGAYSIWNRHNRWPSWHGKINCVIGSAIIWKDFSCLGIENGKEKILEQLVYKMNELKKWIEEGKKGIPP